jgi:hypothetical protein
MDSAMPSINYIVLSAVPLLVLVAIAACAIKLAALVLRYQVRWRDAIVFAVFVAVLSFAGRSVAVAHGLALGAGISLVLEMGLGGWFFSTRGTRKTGEAIGWYGGVVTTAVAQVMLIAVGLALILGMHRALR